MNELKDEMWGFYVFALAIILFFGSIIGVVNPIIGFFSFIFLISVFIAYINQKIG